MRRMRKYGIAAETSPVIKFLCTHVGQPSAIAASLLVPHMLFTVLAATYDWEVAYAFYTGLYFKQFHMQLLSLKFEAELDRIKGKR